MLTDPADAEHGDADEPRQHDPAERAADACGTVVLEVEERGDDDERERHDEAGQRGTDDLQALHGAQHRDRGRDDPVAIEKGAAEKSKEDQRTAGRGPPFLALHFNDQREQRIDAAFPTVVGFEDEAHVLDRYDQDQRPNDQRQQAENVGGGGGDAVDALERVLDRVEGAGSDVAIDHAERGKGDEGEPLAPRVGIGMVTSRRGGHFRCEGPRIRTTGYCSRGRIRRGGRFGHEKGRWCSREGMVRQFERNVSKPCLTIARSRSFRLFPAEDIVDFAGSPVEHFAYRLGLRSVFVVAP